LHKTYKYSEIVKEMKLKLLQNDFIKYCLENGRRYSVYNLNAYT